MPHRYRARDVPCVVERGSDLGSSAQIDSERSGFHVFGSFGRDILVDSLPGSESLYHVELAYVARIQLFAGYLSILDSCGFASEHAGFFPVRRGRFSKGRQWSFRLGAVGFFLGFAGISDRLVSRDRGERVETATVEATSRFEAKELLRDFLGKCQSISRIGGNILAGWKDDSSYYVVHSGFVFFGFIDQFSEAFTTFRILSLGTVLGSVAIGGVISLEYVPGGSQTDL